MDLESTTRKRTPGNEKTDPTETGKLGKSSTQKVPAGKGYVIVPQEGG